MKIDGGCYCKAITYEAELDPEKVGLCHCQDCQQTSASAFRTIAIVVGDTFSITKGEPKTFIKTAESGNQRVLTFCEVCGSGLYSSATGDKPAVYNLRMGTINQRADLTPKYEIWCSSSLDWMPDLSGTTKYDKGFV